ncbi:hypothetical protein PACTADRAFT_76162 [Pachysolen tannophilus NRRL Y-2460]|uniref:Amino acid transporter transmembrane domain-containing protein n=1 Tax=Pachysolen tannophilus NRRL Y-2460 TaxID=669874 RepID=A0A1E4TS08_PACTA|nr:hypothetical protein PACTADRAFT_76162 [Pachysolen tannophilus NRRL Y-2460]
MSNYGPPSLEKETYSKSEIKDVFEDSSTEQFFENEINQENGHDIKYRTCSWQRTAGLLFSEYICLAIMSFPWSYSVLGLVPGLILTVFVALTVLYTGLIITDYCIKHPKTQNICDIGQNLFWGQKWAWYATAICFLLNNILIQGLHVLVGAKYLNTVSNHGGCTVGFSVATAVICLVISLPRTFSQMSLVGIFSAATMFIAVLLSLIFAGIQTHPDGWDGTPVQYNLWPVQGTTYVSGMSAFLNIVYTFVGQITYPSFIAEMKNPREFKKALYVVTICELITFALAGSIIYVYVGNYYMISPAFGSLSGHYKIIAFSFAIPTIAFLGALYGNVSSQFLFFQFFPPDSEHRFSHTRKGWVVWVATNIGLWILAFIIAEVIPFFSDLLSLMSSLFDCWFGFVFWGTAFFRLKQSKYGCKVRHLFPKLNPTEKIEYFINIFLILAGFYILGPGLYASVESIILSYESDSYGSVFTCASNGI